MKGLSQQELDFYHENGYIVKKGLFTPEELFVFHQRFLDIVEKRVSPAKGMLVMKEAMVAKNVVQASGTNAIAKIQMFQNDPVLFEYLKHPGVVGVVQSIVGSSGIKVIHNMLINKPPGMVNKKTESDVAGGRHPLHQDLLYFTDRPEDKICASWTAMEEVNRANGCLVVFPGSHRGLYNEGPTLYTHSRPDWLYVNSAYWGVDLGLLPPGWKGERVWLEMNPGDTVFFHPLLVHGSGRNRSDGFRRAISAHYASTDCHTVNFVSPDQKAMFAELGRGMFASFLKSPAAKALSAGLGIVAGFFARARFTQFGWPESIGLALAVSLAASKVIRYLPVPENIMGYYLFRYATRRNHVVVAGQ